MVKAQGYLFYCCKYTNTNCPHYANYDELIVAADPCIRNSVWDWDPKLWLLCHNLQYTVILQKRGEREKGGRGATYFIADCELSKPYYLHTLSPKG